MFLALNYRRRHYKCQSRRYIPPRQIVRNALGTRLDCEDVSKKDNSRGKSKNLHIQSLLP